MEKVAVATKRIKKRSEVSSTNISSLGTGLGLRRAHFGALLRSVPEEIEWFEVAPENYIDIGGWVYRDFCALREIRPITLHSIALSLGSLDPLNRDYLKRLRKFIRQHNIPLASDHISFSSYQNIYLNDLVPLPFTEEAVRHIAKRIREVQDILEIPFGVENVSYYVPAGAPEMSEADFIRAVIEESGAWFLLDINNVYVNSVNHGFDPVAHLQALPLDKIGYVHTAGHFRKADDFVLDTHGETIADPVWKLTQTLMQLAPIHSIMIERDYNIPPLPELVSELRRLNDLVAKWRIKEQHVAS